jgi:hypothetical protein|tara:strand:- start:401 stop:691 length:291 start_codon:yes stop_codon:yes gene_type:complete
MESRKLGLQTLNKTVEKTEGKFTQAVTYETTTTFTTAGRDERPKGNKLSYERDDRRTLASSLFFPSISFLRREREWKISILSLLLFPRGELFDGVF